MQRRGGGRERAGGGLSIFEDGRRDYNLLFWRCPSAFSIWSRVKGARFIEQKRGRFDAEHFSKLRHEYAHDPATRICCGEVSGQFVKGGRLLFATMFEALTLAQPRCK